MTSAPEHMKNHWWWRPGWGPGSRFYTWHLTFEGADEVHRLVADCRKGLDSVPGLDLIPYEWLHLTMQGIGHVQDVTTSDVQAIVEAAGRRLCSVPSFELTFRAPIVTPEAVETIAEPPGLVSELRAALRAAIGDVWPEIPESEGGFVPHVSVAYSNSAGSAAPIQAAIDAVRTSPATCTVTHAELIALGRDEQMYTWEPVARAALG